MEQKFPKIFKKMAHTIERHRLLRDLKRADDAARLHAEFKSRFLAQMSHEIRTPMNGIIGMASVILQDHSLPSEVRNQVDLIQKSGQALIYLINDILDVSIEGGPFQRTDKVVVFSNAAQPKRATNSYNPQNKRILIVDDGEVNRKVLASMLKIIGCQYDQAVDGEEAIERAKATLYDLILMDIRMPGISGVDATKAIRQLSPSHKQIPVVAVTANAFPEDRDTYLREGMNDFLAKPVDVPKVEGILNKWLGRPIDAAPSNDAVVNSILDDKTITMLRRLNEGGDDDSFLCDLVGTFKSETPQILRDLLEAMAHKDVKKVEHLSHKLKGFSRNLGAGQLAEVLNDVEMSPRCEDQEQVNTWVLIIQSLYDRSVIALDLLAAECKKAS